MFTGLVQHLGSVVAANRSPSGLRLIIDGAGWLFGPGIAPPLPGDSIAINGCCLTVANAGPSVPINAIAFDAIPQTLATTNIGSLRAGDRVNLEHAVSAFTLMGGHFVQGHIDGCGTVERVQTGADWRVYVRLPETLMKYCAPKGSISIEGVSLTLAEVDPQQSTIAVALIPVTLERTTLGRLAAGQAVNIECDMLAKTVVNYLAVFAPRS